MSESDRPSRPSRSQDGRGRHARPDERTPRRIREAPGETPSAGSTRLPRSSRRNGTDADTGRGGTDDRGTRRSDARGAGRRAGTASSRRAATARGRTDRSTGPHDHRQLGPVPVKVVLSLLAVVLLVGGGYAYSAVGRLAGSLSTTSGLNLGNEADGATDILLVGADSRTDAKGNPLTQKQIDMLRAGEETTTNTDTMILIRIPNDGSSATAVSLPRDTYVDAGEYGNLKLNAVYANYKVGKEDELAEEAAATGETPDEKTVEQESTQAGREGLIRSIADLTGISVDHYAEVGLLGFVLLTDAVGGVDVCLKNAVDEPLSGAKFPAGRQTLDGPDALSFVRQRHELPRGDLDRITRQQAYLASLANKILSAKTLSDPGRLSKLNDAVSRSLTIDSGWDIMGLATQMQGLSGGNVTFQTIPVTSIDGTGDNGESVVTVDRSQVHSFFDDLLGDEDKETSTAAETSDADIPDYDAAKSTVSVFNGGDTAGLASRVGDLVADAGFGVGEVGNSTDSGVSESQVNVADTSDPAARDLAEKLGGLKVVEDPDLGAGEITVTLSGTYDGPGSTADDTRTLSGSGEAEPDSSDGADGSGTDGSTDSSGDVGTPGTMEDGGPEDRKAIDAGGLMCVN